MRWITLAVSHGATLALGFALGVYFLPILTAPKGPDKAVVAEAAQSALFRAQFKRGLKGSDFLHWGEGKVSIAADKIVHDGKLAPGPDYKLYLTEDFVDDEASFEKAKPEAQRIGDVKSFNGFVVDVPAGVDVTAYSTVVVWCEAFGEFITSAKYK